MLSRFFRIFLVTIIVGTPIASIQARDANDLFYDSSTHLKQVDAQGAWDVSVGSEDVVIAVIDTGVDIDHPDLRENIWRNNNEIPGDKIDNDNNGFIDDVYGWDFIDNVADPRPKIKTGFTPGAIVHGTIVAGAAGAVGNNEIGVTGVAWNVSIMPLRALDHTGSGLTTDVVEAIDYAVDNGADIINLSFVSTDDDSRLFEAVKRAYEHNVAVVAAAGNEGDDNTTNDLALSPHFPICYSGVGGENYVIGVAGIENDDTKAGYSNFGEVCIDVSAPGTNIPTTSFFQPAFESLRFEYTDGWSGTSLSTPLVSGGLALLKSVRPDVNIHTLAEVLIGTAENIDGVNPGFAGKLGSGRISLSKALAAALGTSNIVPVVPSKSASSVYTLTRIDDVSSQFKSWSISGGVDLSSVIKHAFTIDSFIISDIDNDSEDELILAGSVGDEPRISIYNVKTGFLEESFLVYPSVLRGGLSVTVADIDGDGRKEIFAIAKTNGSPQVRIFDHLGNSKGSFFAEALWGYSSFEIRSSDIDNAEILLVASGTNRGALYSLDGALIENITFSESIENNDSIAFHGESKTIIVSSGKGFEPEVKLFSFTGTLMERFFAYGQSFKGGVAMGLHDVNNDGIRDIITGAGPTGGPHVRMFNNAGVLMGQFFAQSQAYAEGVVVGTRL